MLCRGLFSCLRKHGHVICQNEKTHMQYEFYFRSDPMVSCSTDSLSRRGDLYR